MGSVVIIIVLVCAFVSLLFGVILYCFRRKLRQTCHRAFHRKKRVHQITAPARPTGENEIVLAVTQRRENIMPPGTTGRHNDLAEPITGASNHRPYLLTRHQSFLNRRPTMGSNSDVPSPLVSNLSSLQSLLMSSQVAVFNSSTERLSLSSQNQLVFQPISLHQHILHQQLNGSIGGATSSPFSVSPAVSSSSVHLPQPSYFDEAPPSYQDSMIIQKLRASDRSTGGSGRTPTQHSSHFNSGFPHSSSVMPNSRRSCRM